MKCSVDNPTEEGRAGDHLSGVGLAEAGVAPIVITASYLQSRDPAVRGRPSDTARSHWLITTEIFLLLPHCQPGHNDFYFLFLTLTLALIFLH